MPLIFRSNFIEKCHLGKQRHIGHSYKSGGLVGYKSTTPAEPCWKRAANMAELVASFARIWKRALLTTNVSNSSALNFLKHSVPQIFHPKVVYSVYCLCRTPCRNSLMQSSLSDSVEEDKPQLATDFQMVQSLKFLLDSWHHFKPSYPSQILEKH